MRDVRVREYYSVGWLHRPVLFRNRLRHDEFRNEVREGFMIESDACGGWYQFILVMGVLILLTAGFVYFAWANRGDECVFS